MRDWYFAITTLGIAVAATAAMIGERSYVASAIEWYDADFAEREATGVLLSQIGHTVMSSAVDPDEAERGGDADGDETRTAEPAQSEESSERDTATAPEHPEDKAARTAAERAPPERTRETARSEPAEPAPVLAETPPPAPRPTAPVIRAEAATVPAGPVAILCIAGCGDSKIVYQGMAVSTRAPVKADASPLQPAVMRAPGPSDPVQIECLAGCRDGKRAFAASAAAPAPGVAGPEPVVHQPARRRDGKSNVKIQRWTRTDTASY